MDLPLWTLNTKIILIAMYAAVKNDRTAQERLVNVGLPWTALDQCVPCKTWHGQIWPPRPDSDVLLKSGLGLTSTYNLRVSISGNCDLEIQASRLWIYRAVMGWWCFPVVSSLGVRYWRLSLCILNKHYPKPPFKTGQAGHTLIYNLDRLWTETGLSLFSKSGYRPPPQA